MKQSVANETMITFHSVTPYLDTCVLNHVNNETLLVHVHVRQCLRHHKLLGGVVADSPTGDAL